MDFVETGRQAYREGLTDVIADNPRMRELWPSIPATQHRQVIRDYADGWKAEQRETNPVEALTEDAQATERLIASLDREIATTRHARRLATLKRNRGEAGQQLARLVADIDAAKMED